MENYEEGMEKILALSGDATSAQLIKVENRAVDNSPDAQKLYYAAYEYKNGDNYDILELVLENSEVNCCLLRHINFKRMISDQRPIMISSLKSWDLNAYFS